MARETMRAKIERLEKENVNLHEVVQRQDNEIQKLKNELERLKKKRKKIAETDNLELIAQQLDEAQNSSDRWHREFFNEQQKNKMLVDEVQKLKNEKSKMTRSKVIRENEELKKEIESKEEHIKSLYLQQVKADEEVKKVKKEHQELFEAYKKDLERVKDEYKKGNVKKHNERGAGRKREITDQERTEIKKHRACGKTIKEIAALFNRSVGIIHKIVNEGEGK